MAKKNLTPAEILHLASLSKLVLTDSEVKKLTGQLTETLDYVENLNEVSSEDRRRKTEDGNRRTEDGRRKLDREDKIENERILNQEKKGKYFVVKRIL